MIESQAAASSQSQAPAPAKAGVGRLWWRAIAGTILLLGVTMSASARGTTDAVEPRLPVALLAANLGSPSYADGPPPGFSGGFGEDHCRACHFGDGINDAQGRVTISAPELYVPGQTYPVTVTLTRPGMKLGGFQLTARFEQGGTQAGTLALSDGDEERIKVLTDREVQYAYHRKPGSALTGPNVVRWTLRWTAPASGGAVQFNVAANAADADETQFGEFVYTAVTRSRPR